MNFLVGASALPRLYCQCLWLIAFFCGSGATAALSTSLTQIRAYLLTSQRLSLSLTRPGQFLGTQSGHFLSSSPEILLRRSRHDAVHRQGWGGSGGGGGSPPGSTGVRHKIHKNSPYISGQASFSLCRDGVKLCHGPGISIKRPPQPLASSSAAGPEKIHKLIRQDSPAAWDRSADKFHVNFPDSLMPRLKTGSKTIQNGDLFSNVFQRSAVSVQEAARTEKPRLQRRPRFPPRAGRGDKVRIVRAGGEEREVERKQSSVR